VLMHEILCECLWFRAAYVRRMAKPSVNSIDHPKKAPYMSYITIMLFASACYSRTKWSVFKCIEIGFIPLDIKPSLPLLP